jgi:hypothetical protein
MRIKANSSAAVAEFKQQTVLVLQNAARFFSNCFVLGPVVIQPDRSASTTSSISSFVISGGEKGIILGLLKEILLLVSFQNFLETYWFSLKNISLIC